MEGTQITDLVIDSLKSIIATKGEAKFECDEGTMIFGIGSAIDSLDLVNLVVMLEEKLKESVGAEITIVDEVSLDGAQSPFRTIGTLSRHISQKLHDQ